jgi:uncharacterized protein HemX
MIIALHFSIALGVIALGLTFWSIRQHQMNNDLHLVEVDHIHQGMNALMNDFNKYQVETDRKIVELEKQLEIKTKQLDRKTDKIRKELPTDIRKVIGHIEFAKPLDK